MATIDHLQNLLHSSMQVQANRLNIHVITETLAALENTFGNAAVNIDTNIIDNAIADFRSTREIQSFRQLKHLCYGIDRQTEDQPSILSRPESELAIIFQAVRSRNESQQMQCIKRLLIPYWQGARNAQETQGFESTRSFLAQLTAELNETLENQNIGRDIRRQWFRALVQHNRVLSDSPCQHYAEQLLNQDDSDFKEVIEKLSIPTEGWFIKKTMLKQIECATALNDAAFKEKLPILFNILNENEQNIGNNIRKKMLVLILIRYAQSKEKPENQKLRDLCVREIGNPWVRIDEWQTHVKINHQFYRPAHQMVMGWLRKRLMRDFFEILAGDGVNDPRRLNYWMRYESKIEDMWFILGSESYYNDTPEYIAFKDRSYGRIMYLKGGAENNAFVMKFGSYLAVEFGETGNAFYFHRYDQLPITDQLEAADPDTQIYTDGRGLKDTNRLFTQNHMDSPAQLKSWEQKLDDELRQYNLTASEPAACTPELQNLINKNKAQWTDKRGQGGYLTIKVNQKHNYCRMLKSKLEELGFNYVFSRDHWTHP